MAYILDDPEKQQQDPNQQNQQAQPGALQAQNQMNMTSDAGYVGNTVGGGSSPVVSTAGIGKGGTGGWTNVQAYMNANRGDTGSANMLQDKVGTQFSKERSDLQTQADNTKSEAQKAAGSVLEAKNSMGDWLDQAGQAYQYAPEPKGSGKATGGTSSGQFSEKATPTNPNVNYGDSSVYDEYINKFKNVLSSQYGGPTSFDHSFSDQTQDYGRNLGDNGAFNQMLGDMYQERAGGPLAKGNRLLQEQLDVSNDSLVNTRQSLLDQYAGLGDLRDQTVRDTTAALSDAANQYRVNQNALRDYLGNTANQLDTSISKQEAAARAAYANALKSGSGLRAAPLNYELPGAGPTGSGLKDQYANLGILKDDMTWADLQKEQDNFGKLWSPSSPNPSAPYLWSNMNALNSWYAGQDEKYAMTADAEERKWNAIQDILETEAERKKQGFSVRG
jgi:hypothetical protein